MVTWLLALMLFGTAADQPRSVDDVVDEILELIEQDSFTSPEWQGLMAEIEALAVTGDPYARNMLGIILENGYGRDMDLAAAEQLYRELAAEASDEPGLRDVAEFNLGRLLLFADRSDEAEAAFANIWERRGVMAGPALEALTRTMLTRSHAPSNLDAVAALLEDGREARLANPVALGWLASLHQAGQLSTGVNRDAARRALAAGAEAGGAEAAWRLAMMDREDPQYRPGAFDLIRQAAEGGYVDGMISLAVMLATGELTEPDPEEARYWYLQAAASGSAHAHRGLGVMLIAGEGGPADPALGYALIDLAIAGGDDLAPRVAEVFPAQGFPRPPRADIDRARREWLERHALTEADIGPTR